MVTPSLSISQAYGWYKALRTDEVKLDALAVSMADLGDTDTNFSVPVFFIQGENDNVAPTSLVANYVAKIKAPAKRLDVVPDAGHFVMWTHPREFLSARREDVRTATAENNPPK